MQTNSIFIGITTSGEMLRNLVKLTIPLASFALLLINSKVGGLNLCEFGFHGDHQLGFPLRAIRDMNNFPVSIYAHANSICEQGVADVAQSYVILIIIDNVN